MSALTSSLENAAFTAPYFEVALATIGWFILKRLGRGQIRHVSGLTPHT